jgi:tetratricopeptide (TPR) repeat protein
LHKPDDAWTELKTSQSLDPVSQVTGIAVVMSLNYSRRYDEAVIAAKQRLQLYPDSFVFHTLLGDIYVQKGRESLAVAEYLKAEELLGSAPSRIAALQRATRVSGLRGFLRRKLVLDQNPMSPASALSTLPMTTRPARSRKLPSLARKVLRGERFTSRRVAP